MKKSTLFNYVMWGFQSNMDGKDYEDLKNKLLLISKEHKEEEIGSLAESIVKNHPELQIMHQSFMRSRMDKISSGVNTIKIIAILYLIGSIIGAIAIMSQMK